jgi:hypothetical protein
MKKFDGKSDLRTYGQAVINPSVLQIGNLEKQGLPPANACGQSQKA